MNKPTKFNQPSNCDVSWLSEEKLQELLHPKPVSFSENLQTDLMKMAPPILTCQDMTSVCSPCSYSAFNNPLNIQPLPPPTHPLGNNVVRPSSVEPILNPYCNNAHLNELFDRVLHNSPHASMCMNSLPTRSVGDSFGNNLNQNNFLLNNLQQNRFCFNNRPDSNQMNSINNKSLKQHDLMTVPCLDRMKQTFGGDDNLGANFRRCWPPPNCTSVNYMTANPLLHSSYGIDPVQLHTGAAPFTYFSVSSQYPQNPIYSYTTPNVDSTLVINGTKTSVGFSTLSPHDLARSSSCMFPNYNVSTNVIQDKLMTPFMPTYNYENASYLLNRCPFTCHSKYLELKCMYNELSKQLVEDRKIIMHLLENFNRLSFQSYSKRSCGTSIDIKPSVNNEEKGTNTTFFFDPSHRVPDLSLFNNTTDVADESPTRHNQDNRESVKEQIVENTSSAHEDLAAQKHRDSNTQTVSSAADEKEDNIENKDEDAFNKMYQRTFDATTRQLKRLGVDLSDSTYDINSSNKDANHELACSPDSDHSDVSNLALKYLDHSDIVKELNGEKTFMQNLSINTKNYFEKYCLFPKDDEGGGTVEKNDDAESFWIFDKH